MVYGSLNNPPVSAQLDHRWHGCMLVEKIGVQIVVLSRELHTSMSALASSELGCSPRGRNYWRIGCIKMVAPTGSLLTGSSSTFCLVALNIWHLLALCPASLEKYFLYLDNVQHDASGCAQPRRYWMEGIHGRQSLQGNCRNSGRTLCHFTLPHEWV